MPRADDAPGTDRLSTAAFAVGLAAALTGVVYFVAIPLGIVGLVLGVFARRRAEPGARRVAIGAVLLSCVGLLVGLGVVAFLVASDDDGDDGAPSVIDGVESGTADDVNPPQHDLAGTVDCQAEIGALRAAGTVTNRTDRTATYQLIAVWEHEGRRVAEATAVVEDVAAGAVQRWEVTAVGDGDVSTTCRVLRIDREAE